MGEEGLGVRLSTAGRGVREEKKAMAGSSGSFSAEEVW